MSLLSDILSAEHPVFTKYGKDGQLWEKNERRLDGGEEVLSELFPWDYEIENSTHYQHRKSNAVYVNFPARMAEKFVGHLSSEAPVPGESVNFGNLGDIHMPPVNEVSQADLLYYSADSAGGEGLDWVSFFDRAHKNAMATGHRWIAIEVPDANPDQPRFVSDELEGQRPYLIEYSPRQVPNWHYENGSLQYVLFKFSSRIHEIKGAKMEIADKTRYLLYVRNGWEGFGATYGSGGWWLYDDEENLLSEGDWSKTNGEIPAIPFFYEGSNVTFSRPALTQIGQIAVAYMNLDSAGDNDAIEGGIRRLFGLGVGSEEHQTVKDQIDQGSRWVSVPTTTIDGRNPQLFDSAQATANEAIESRMKKKEEQAHFIAMDEMKIGPNASGIARLIEFADTKAPRLSLMARNRSIVENFCLNMAIMRWGLDPMGAYIQWKYQFDINPISGDIKEIFEIMSERSIDSPTAEALCVEMLFRDKGLATGKIGDAMETIKNEVRTLKEAALAIANAEAEVVEETEEEPVEAP